ncbi:MAG: hypothetical protein ACLUUO_14110 [Sellimonas intestinalis]
MADRAQEGIEMNMAGFKYGLGFCHPYPEIIRRYRELGGEIITVGSDAHQRITSPTSMRTRVGFWNSVVSVLYDIYRQKAKIFEDQLSCLAIQNKRLLRSKSQKRIGKNLDKNRKET